MENYEKEYIIDSDYDSEHNFRLCAGCSQPVKWPAGARKPAGRIAKAG